MIPVTLAQIAALTGGVVVGTDDPDAVLVTGDVVTDSRAAQAGSRSSSMSSARPMLAWAWAAC